MQNNNKFRKQSKSFNCAEYYFQKKKKKFPEYGTIKIKKRNDENNLSSQNNINPQKLKKNYVQVNKPQNLLSNINDNYFSCSGANFEEKKGIDEKKTINEKKEKKTFEDVKAIPILISNSKTKIENEGIKKINIESVFDDLFLRFIGNLPDEEYVDKNRIFFQIEEAFWFYEDFYRENKEELPKLTFEKFTLKIFENFSNLFENCSTEDEVKKLTSEFLLYKYSVPVCGGVILNEKLNKFLLVKGFYHHSWSFPKGKINKNESDLKCAIREIKEEIGLDCEKLIDENEFVELSENLKRKKIRYYMITGVNENYKFNPQTRKEIEEIKWFPIENLFKNKRLSSEFYPLKKCLPKILIWIKKKKNNNSKINKKENMSPMSPLFEETSSDSSDKEKNEKESEDYNYSSSLKNFNFRMEDIFKKI